MAPRLGRGGRRRRLADLAPPPLLATAPLLGSLRLFDEAGIERMRAKSLALTGYLIELLEATGLTATRRTATGSARRASRRGAAATSPSSTTRAPRIARALKARGVIPDFRPPDVVRLAPIPLYTSYHELWQVVRHLREIVERGEYLPVDAGRDLVA